MEILKLEVSPKVSKCPEEWQEWCPPQRVQPQRFQPDPQSERSAESRYVSGISSEKNEEIL